MAKVLVKPQHVQIFSQIKSSFSDFHLFDNLVSEKLKQAIIDSDNIEINFKTTKKVVERYFDIEAFKTPEQKLIWAQIQLIFKACYVLILSNQPSSQALFWEDTDTLLDQYPQFASVDNDELQLLLNFRNMTKITLMVIPARLNKQCILKIAGRLEGSQNEYITGGGQKPAVTRRVEIYEREGGISAEKRPDRVRGKTPQEGETGSKRSATTFSEKKVKLVRLQTDEMRFLAKGPANPFPTLGGGSASADYNSVSAQLSRHTVSTTINGVSSTQSRDEVFMSPLSALSAAASRMLPAPALQHASVPAQPEFSDASFTKLAGMPSLSRANSELLSSFILPSDNWRDAFGPAQELKPAGAQRNVSLGLPDFSETLQLMFPTDVGTVNGDGKAPAQLNRGFSLGFYSSSFPDEFKSLFPSSPVKE